MTKETLLAWQFDGPNRTHTVPCKEGIPCIERPPALLPPTCSGEPERFREISERVEVLDDEDRHEVL